MRLFRYGNSGSEKPGVLHNGKHLDVSSFGEDFGEKFFENDGLNRLKKFLQTNTSLPEVKPARFGPPMTRPSKIVCIGLNYADHAKESNMELPKEPSLMICDRCRMQHLTDLRSIGCHPAARIFRCSLCNAVVSLPGELRPPPVR